MDYFDIRRPRHEEVLHFVELACAHNAELLYAASSSKDLFYLFGKAQKDSLLLERKAPVSAPEAKAINGITWDLIEDLNKLATPVGCDISDVWLARGYREFHSDFEDNLIIAAAQRSSADYLVTNDELLLRHCPVATVDVQDAIKLLQM